ncbi:molybdopterin biosynthesis protein [Desulfotalea psychrophila]|uniref:Molybdopterin molybdenumtransferase n=1 Tax=Desulfotalea psychrophila (strain LSv54 / DSM 12343) TaxID=177439 RepID=Q6AKC1_DESPS|nr:molybdopterin biosynthesis protein [Desulfotalea psychrophila]CAG37204.1 related to molybdopterin biosynthesis protein (MoeA) [Desulfotalea psychrophila LSv54]
MATAKRKNVYLENKPLAEAKELWSRALTECGFSGRIHSEIIAVDDARGRISAGAVFARRSSPSYNAAAMDGIAVHFTDLSQASEAAPTTLSPEQFSPVNTGNAIKESYNAVVMIEDVHLRTDGQAEVTAPATPWQHIRTIGEDIVATELIIPEGQVIRPIDLGAMLAAGVTEIEVIRPPQIKIIPTGTELIQPHENPQAGQIIEFNTRILGGYLEEWGATVQRNLPVQDDPKKLREALLAAIAEHDMVIINAGASAGTKDFTSSVIAELGTLIVHGVAIKPGKPVMLGIIKGTPVVGLPGYPISALLTMRVFVREMVAAFLNQATPQPDYIYATMSRPVHSTMGVDQIVRITLGRVGDKLMATPSGKGAGAVMSFARADGLLSLPTGSEGVGAGEPVPIELLRPQTEVDSTLVCIGSHDNILDLMANQIHATGNTTRISSAHVGSMGGIMAIRRGESHFGGCHLLDEETGEYNIPFIKRFLRDIPLELINLCYRQQGLMVAKGNPYGITSFQDLVDKNLLFINRQNGAGTRLLTDKILREQNISPEDLSGYEREEYTHMSVAAAVANGSVQAGMGIRAAAEALELDFISVAEERYDLILPTAFANDPKIITLLEMIRGSEKFHHSILALGGYNLRDCGRVFYRQ